MKARPFPEGLAEDIDKVREEGGSVDTFELGGGKGKFIYNCLTGCLCKLLSSCTLHLHTIG